ncbi:MAG: hypothetical protein PHT59_03345, partial [Candidatus Omnitrophica bacterium]|nr:hypothetical protein [Candidatus Omnitrophota bacterium]
MIVPMKKIWVVCLAREARQAVAHLRRVGVMHVEHQQPPQGKDITVLSEDIAAAESALDILSQYSEGKARLAQTAAPDWKLACRHIIDLAKRLEQLTDFSRLLKSRIAEWEQWGDFDPHALDALARKNVFIRFYQIPVKEASAVADGCIVRAVSVRGGTANCVVVSREKKELPFREVAPPKASLGAMRQRLEQDALVEKALKKDLARHADHYADIRAQRDALKKELEFQQAVTGMGLEGSLGYIKGYAPHDRVELVQREARRQDWGLLIEDPAEDDSVPTLLRQPSWIAVIRPLLDFLGIIPGYREMDVSLTFLVFFSIFFGILIGDAGYGLAYLLLTRFFLRKKLGTRHAAATTLLYVLSCSAIMWGVFTGTFFGQEWLAVRGIRGLVPVLNDAKFAQTLCFFLGALQLSIAHSWRTVLKLPSLSALADVGWLLVVWSAFFLARTLILGDPFPAFEKPLIYGGI